MYHVSQQVYCARLYSMYLYYVSSVQIYVKGIKQNTEFLSKLLLRSSNTFLTPRMTLRPIVSLRNSGMMVYV